MYYWYYTYAIDELSSVYGWKMKNVTFINGDWCIGGVCVKTRKGIHGIKLLLFENRYNYLWELCQKIVNKRLGKKW